MVFKLKADLSFYGRAHLGFTDFCGTYSMTSIIAAFLDEAETPEKAAMIEELQ